MYLHFFWLMMYFCLVWVIHDRERYIDLYMFLVSHYLLIYIYELFMIYVFFEIKKLFLFYLYFFTHAFMRLLSVSGNIQVNSVMLLSTLAIDR